MLVVFLANYGMWMDQMKFHCLKSFTEVIQKELYEYLKVNPRYMQILRH